MKRLTLALIMVLFVGCHHSAPNAFSRCWIEDKATYPAEVICGTLKQSHLSAIEWRNITFPVSVAPYVAKVIDK